MNWSKDTSREDINSLVNIEREGSENAANGLFEGDMGELPLDTRRALVQLLSGPSLDERRHSKLWSVLLRDEGVIRRRLADLFLELVIDCDLNVAFTRQADSGDLEIPKLLRRAQLTFIDSVLLLFLRQQLAQAASHGERAVVSKTDIIENLKPFDRSGNTDKAGFDKRVFASIEKVKKFNILQKIRASDDRFEVSPTLKLLFSAEEIQSLTELYKKITADGLQDDSGDAPSEEADYKSEEEE